MFLPKDKATGKEQKIAIQASGGLDDKEKMVQDAEENAESDKKEMMSKPIKQTLVNGAEKA